MVIALSIALMAKPKLNCKTKDLIAHFGGSVQRVANYFGINRVAVYQWDEHIPQIRAFQVREDFPHLVEEVERDAA